MISFATLHAPPHLRPLLPPQDQPSQVRSGDRAPGFEIFGFDHEGLLGERPGSKAVINLLCLQLFARKRHRVQLRRITELWFLLVFCSNKTLHLPFTPHPISSAPPPAAKATISIHNPSGIRWSSSRVWYVFSHPPPPFCACSRCRVPRICSQTPAPAQGGRRQMAVLVAMVVCLRYGKPYAQYEVFTNLGHLNRSQS